MLLGDNLSGVLTRVADMNTEVTIQDCECLEDGNGGIAQ